MGANEVIAVSDIADMLRPHADSLARRLLPGGGYAAGRSEWKCSGSLNPTGQAISVHVGRGVKQGLCGFWNGVRAGGDLLDLIEAVRGGNKRDAVIFAKTFLGIGVGGDPVFSPVSPAQKAEMERLNAAHVKAEAADRETRVGVARRTWDSAGPLQGVGVGYLRSRGIDASRYADGELRFYHGLFHPDGGTFPTIVARVADVQNQTVGVWRSYLKADGSGKAPVETPRLGLGNCKGGAVRIGGVWPEIGVAEGIENALAARQLVHQTCGRLIPVWPTLSTVGMRFVELPPEIGRVRIYADHDAIKFRRGDGAVLKSPGLSAATELATRLLAEGRDVVVEKPPAGLDWTQVINMTDAMAA